MHPQLHSVPLRISSNTINIGYGEAVHLPASQRSYQLWAYPVSLWNHFMISSRFLSHPLKKKKRRHFHPIRVLPITILKSNELCPAPCRDFNRIEEVFLPTLNRSSSLELFFDKPTPMFSHVLLSPGLLPTFQLALGLKSILTKPHFSFPH